MENYILKSLVKLAVLTVMVSSFAACAKKSGGGSEVNQPAAPAKTLPPFEDGNNDSIDPVVVTDPDGTESQVPAPKVQGEDQAEDQGKDQGQDAPKTSKTPKSSKPETRAQTSGDLQSRRNEAAKSSGTADDALRAMLVDKLNSVEAVYQLRNIRSAQAVKSASLKLGNTIEMRIITQMKKGEKETVFKGSLQGRSAQLVGMIDGKMVGATLACRDADFRSCETVSARIELGSKGTLSYVYIVFRNTAATLSAQFADQKCATLDCQDLFNMLATSALADKDLHNVERGAMALKSVRLETFEVINGKTGMKLSLITQGRELLKISGELLRNRETRASTAIDFRDQNGTGLKTNLNSKMNEVSIVSNNGRGSITASITTRDDRSSDKFYLTAKRTSKPLQMLGETLK